MTRARPERALRLRKRLEAVIAAGHPWVFRDALGSEPGRPGEVVRLEGADGRFLARGLAEAGPIGVRLFTTKDEPLDDGLLARRVAAARELRARVVPGETSAYRLLHGEGDRLPGLVCDVYGDAAVVQLDGAAAGAWRGALLRALEPALEAAHVGTVLLRTGRRGERQTERVRGALPAGPRAVTEHGMTLFTDLVAGQKTGLFLDHRESRRSVRALAAGLRVLNLYSYTGGFSVAAGLGGALRVTSVDVAPGAVALAERTWAANALDPRRHEAVAADVAAYLRAGKVDRGAYDLIVADPPSFAPNERSVPKALASYRALHRACLELLPPGGLYLAASCSSHVRRDAFEGTVLDAARQARSVLQLLSRSGAPPDHPRLLAFPEGDYLKVALYRRLE